MKKVLFKGEILNFTLNGPRAEPSLQVTKPHQMTMPKMECHGYPTETCIFLDSLTKEELNEIKNIDGSDFDLENEIKILIANKR